MSNVLKKRMQKLERIRNPPMTIEDLMAWCGDENRQPIRYVPGENPMLDFLYSLTEELNGQGVCEESTIPDTHIASTFF